MLSILLKTLSPHGGYLARQNKPGNGKGKVTEREKKRKLLTDRRRPLNIDHLNTEKLKNKTKDLCKFLAILEEERFDFECIAARQKYDVSSLRQRVQMFLQMSGKGKSMISTINKVKTMASVGDRAKNFK